MFLFVVAKVTFESRPERRRGRNVHPGAVRVLPALGNSGMVNPSRAASDLLMCDGNVEFEVVVLITGGSWPVDG